MISRSVSNSGVKAEVLLQMSRLYEPFNQIMEAPAHLCCVTMLVMVDTFLTMILFGFVRSEGSGPPEVEHVLDHRKKLLIGYGEGCEGRSFRTALLLLPSSEWPWPVQRFDTSLRTTSGCLSDNQDLLGGYSHVIFEH